MRPLRCLETSLNNYAATQHRIPQERIPHSCRREDLKNLFYPQSTVQQPKEQLEFLCVRGKSRKIKITLRGASTSHQILMGVIKSRALR